MLVRHDWSLEAIKDLNQTALFELVSKAHEIHKQFHAIGEIQVCKLISIKTGGCIEDCKYCSQSSRYSSDLKAEPLMKVGDVVQIAKEAVSKGATRICLGAAWRKARTSGQFDRVLQMVREIRSLGVEVCCTLGMLGEKEAEALKQSGLTAYNHNLDTSRDYYSQVITTRTYEDRLETLSLVAKKEIDVCCGGILGMGESLQDRLELLVTLSNLRPHPESVPVNMLTPIKGTPLESQPLFPFWEFLRFIAITRIVLPKSVVRLSSGRIRLSHEQQTLCFFAGANSIFTSDTLLTVGNNSPAEDDILISTLGLKKRPAFKRVS